MQVPGTGEVQESLPVGWSGRGRRQRTTSLSWTLGPGRRSRSVFKLSIPERSCMAFMLIKHGTGSCTMCTLKVSAWLYFINNVSFSKNSLGVSVDAFCSLFLIGIVCAPALELF